MYRLFYTNFEQPNQALQLTPLARPEPGRDLPDKARPPVCRFAGDSSQQGGTSPATGVSRHHGGGSHFAGGSFCRRPVRSRRLPAAQLKARRWAAGRHVVLLQAQNRHVRAAGKRASRDGSRDHVRAAGKRASRDGSRDHVRAAGKRASRDGSSVPFVRRENKPVTTAGRRSHVRAAGERASRHALSATRARPPTKLCS
jgi:hypothetical protein